MQKSAHDARPLSVDVSGIEERTSSPYPKPYADDVIGRTKRAIGNVFDLTQFGVNYVTLEPGAMSAQRHWHAREDEFVYVLEGEITLITDQGETVLQPGTAAGFKAGNPNGHSLVNRTTDVATYLEVGTRFSEDEVEYPDIDMRARKKDGRWQFMHKDGTPYDVPDG